MNPNVTAIFLAMSVPVFLYRFKSPHKKKYLMGFTIVITALLLLKCRAAIIGSAVAAAVYFSLEYSFISWAKKEKNRTTLKALIVISLLVLAALGNQLYKSKKASADGRIFIWKLSSLMIMDNPVLGCGYGLFQRDFNLFQAQYIQEGKATPKELQNAGPTVFAQNEILQNLTEGGFAGLLIMSCFFGSLIISVRQKKNPVKAVLAQEKTSADHSGSLYNLSYSGVVAFLSMGLVNFTIQSVPAMAMMTIYAAIICSIIEPVKLSRRLVFLEKHRSFSITAYTALIFVSIYLMFSIFAIASADIQNRKAFLFKKEGHIQKALLCMPSLEKRLKNNCDYWKNYAGIHFKMQNYSSAIRCIQKAKETSVHPELYLASGVCYEKLKQYPQAVKQYYQLVMLHPSKFAYRFALMNAYLQNKDTANTVKEARGILDLHPKIFSDKVTHYKRAAYKLLKILDDQQHPASEISKITK
ncbi:O-antigen ligase family protein [Flavobacterium sp.]|uniref:O-antigen ligase family protein n=1 Tax=Flavobacterium sp. TaxID=239 RepID=UPI003D0F7FD8